MSKGGVGVGRIDEATVKVEITEGRIAFKIKLSDSDAATTTTAAGENDDGKENT